MKTIFRFGLPSEVARLLLLLCFLAVPDGRAAGAPALPSEGWYPADLVGNVRFVIRCPGRESAGKSRQLRQIHLALEIATLLGIDRYEVATGPN